MSASCYEFKIITMWGIENEFSKKDTFRDVSGDEKVFVTLQASGTNR